jgi:SAM-dependent methyltransferase
LKLHADIGPGSRVLEIGCGTGQATVPLAHLGCEIVALDLGAELVAVARRRLARFPTAEVVVSSFEDWQLPPLPFDAVVSATAFHWLDPTVRVEKSAAALRPGGALAIVSTHHVAGGTEQFWIEVQGCYERFDPDTEPGLRLPLAADIPTSAAELESSGKFAPPEIRRYEWDQPYDSAEYIDLLLTYSGHRALEATRREALLGCIRELLQNRFGGRIAKRYLTQLLIARRS